MTNSAQVPVHVAVIMDGNGRWAKQQGQKRSDGHKAGANTVDQLIHWAGSHGVNYLTLYAFAIQNWKRPPDEVTQLMSLLVQFCTSKRQVLMTNRVRLRTIGNIAGLPVAARTAVQAIEALTANNDGLVVTLALNYDGRDEIVRAVRKLAAGLRPGALADISDEMISSFLDTAGMPDPDLIVRTSGEQRLSRFLPWQGADAELLFDPTPFPALTEAHFDAWLEEYGRRERRHGATPEQVKLRVVP